MAFSNNGSDEENLQARQSRLLNPSKKNLTHGATKYQATVPTRNISHLAPPPPKKIHRTPPPQENTQLRFFFQGAKSTEIPFSKKKTKGSHIQVQGVGFYSNGIGFSKRVTCLGGARQENSMRKKNYGQHITPPPLFTHENYQNPTKNRWEETILIRYPPPLQKKPASAKRSIPHRGVLFVKSQPRSRT